jgi:hypothetical protein
MNRDALALLYTSIIVAGFFIAGLFNILDYFIVKALLVLGYLVLFIYLIKIVLKDIENKNHLD